MIGAGTLASGLTLLGYVSAAHFTDRIIQPDEALTARYVSSHATGTAWLLAALVAIACLLAYAAALVARNVRSPTSGRVSFKPNQPLWVSSLGSGPDTPITVEMRDGRTITGYLAGNDVNDEPAPTLYLGPPIVVHAPEPDGGRFLLTRTDKPARTYRHNELTIPGREVVAVWTPLTNK